MILTDIDNCNTFKEALQTIFSEQSQIGECFTVGEITAHIRRCKPAWDFSHKKELIPNLETIVSLNDYVSGETKEGYQVYGPDLASLDSYEDYDVDIPDRLPRIDRYTFDQLEELSVRVDTALHTSKYIK